MNAHEDITLSLLDCGHPNWHRAAERARGEYVLTTGYGIAPGTNRRICYACCAERDRERMIADGRAVLYLASAAPPGSALQLQNWPGSLTFPVRGHRRATGYGFGGSYPIVTGFFIGPDGRPWTFRHAGNNSQLAHCRRIRA